MILFYYGTDGGRIHQAVRELAVRYLAKHPGALNLSRLDCDTPEHRTELERAMRNRSFFGEPTLIICRGAFSEPDASDHLIRLLEDSSTASEKDLVLLVREDRGEKDLRKASRQLWDILQKQSKRPTCFEPLSGAKLTAWMNDYCSRRGCSLSPGAAAALQTDAGTDSWSLMHELEKLCVWSRWPGAIEDARFSEGENRHSGLITVDAVRRLAVRTAPQSQVFALTDALSGRNKREALRELDRQLASGADPHYLLAMYAFAVRNILSVRDLTDRGCAPAVIATRTKLHPFVVKKSLGAARLFTVRELTDAHRWLCGADRDTKRGSRDALDALYDFVLSVI